MTPHKQEVIERTLDWAAAATAIGALIEMLPAIAAAFTIVWTGIRIYETRTVQAWISRRRARRVKKVS